MDSVISSSLIMDNESEYYPITLSKKKFFIKFDIKDNIILFIVLCSKKKSQNTFCYLHQSRLEALRENSKILQLYPSISEIQTLFCQLLNNKKIYLEYNKNDDNTPIDDEINLIIKLNVLMKEEILLLPLEKKNVNFEMTENNSSNDNIDIYDVSNNYLLLKQKFSDIKNFYDKEINTLTSQLKKLRNQNNELKSQISDLNNEVNQLNDIISKNYNKNSNSNINNDFKYPLSSIQSLIDRIEILEELKEESTKSSNYKNQDGINMLLSSRKIKEKINSKKLKKCFKSSTILSNVNFDFLLNKLSKFNPTSYKIIYKSSIDGDNIKTFHLKCDSEENVLILIETINGLIFGGYTSVGFDSSGHELRDDNAFLFSVDKQQIYDIVKGNNAIYCNRKCGPIFCAKPDSTAYNIFIPDKYLSHVSTTTKKSYCYQIEGNFSLNNGSKEFMVKEMEVFRIDFD